MQANKYDLSQPHALLYTEMSYGYGHVNICISKLIELDWLNQMPAIRISMQTGGGGSPASYAWRFGVEGGEPMRAAILTECLKIMRRIEKRLEKFTNELGEPVDYAEFCHRILVASEVPVIFIRQELRDRRNIDDLPMLRPKRDGAEIRSIIANLEHKMLMETCAEYRDKQHAIV